jgi:tetratricopeptide (TPR) repeat protein
MILGYDTRIPASFSHKLRTVLLRAAVILFVACQVLSHGLWGQLNPNHNLSRAQDLIQKGSFAKALPICLQVIQQEPRSADAYVLLGITYAGLERNEDAITALRHAIQLRPSSLPAHANLGIVYMQTQQMEAAAAELEKAVELGDHSWSTLYNLVLCYSATGKPEKAKPLLFEVISLAPDRPEPRLTLASVELVLGEQKAALSELKKAELLAPTDWALRERIGTLLLEQGAFDGAAQELDLVVEHDPQDGSARLRLAEAYLRLKQYQDVLRVLSSPPARKWDNQQGAAADHLSGAAHAGLQNWRSAIDDCRKAVDADPKAVYYAELVEIQLKAAAMDDALVSARAGVEKFPDSPETLRVMAAAAVANNATEEAIPALQSLIRLNPADQQAHMQLANVYLSRGEFEQAQGIYATMRERFSKSEEPYFGFALVLIRQGKPLLAKGYLEQALQINPNLAGALYYLGKILYGEGQIPQALEYLKRSLAHTTFEPDLVAIHFQIAQCYRRLGENDKAQEEMAIHKKLLDELEGRLLHQGQLR